MRRSAERLTYNSLSWSSIEISGLMKSLVSKIPATDIASVVLMSASLAISRKYIAPTDRHLYFPSNTNRRYEYENPIRSAAFSTVMPLLSSFFLRRSVRSSVCFGFDSALPFAGTFLLGALAAAAAGLPFDAVAGVFAFWLLLPADFSSRLLFLHFCTLASLITPNGQTPRRVTKLALMALYWQRSSQSDDFGTL